MWRRLPSEPAPQAVTATPEPSAQEQEQLLELFISINISQQCHFNPPQRAPVICPTNWTLHSINQEHFPCVLNEEVPSPPIRQILNKDKAKKPRQRTETPHTMTLIADQLQIKSFNFSLTLGWQETLSPHSLRDDCFGEKTKALFIRPWPVHTTNLGNSPREISRLWSMLPHG